MLREKGQSTLEYVIVLTAIIAAILGGVFLFARKDSNVGVGKMMDSAVTTMESKTGKIIPE